MINRRAFLQTTAVILSTPALPAALALDARGTRLIVQAGCESGMRFNRALSRRAEHVAEDAMDVIADISVGLETPDFGTCLGLTRAPVAMLVTHALAERGFAVHYRGEHRLLDRRWQHVLSGDGQLLQRLEGIMAGSRDHWATGLGKSAVIMAGSVPGHADLATCTPARAGHEPFHELVSFCLRRVPGFLA